MMKSLMMVAVLLASVASAQDAGVSGSVGNFPRFASLKKGEVNVRSGPGNQYPTLWVYQRSGYPVQLLARYDNYYKVRDVEAEEGWVYIGMVSGKKTGLVGGQEPLPLYRKADATSDIVARLAPGVVVGLEECTGVLCKVEVEGYSGWASKERLLMVE